MRDAIVVGCGIIGATVSKVLTLKGMEVLTIDDARPMNGTTPSGGHLKPSWFGGMKKADYEPAMELLSDSWGMYEDQFAITPAGINTGLTATVFRVDTDLVTAYPRTLGKVTSIGMLNNYPMVTYEGSDGEVVERCRLLVVSAGAWCSELLPEIVTTAKQGVSFRFAGQLSYPFIQPWAPYKQIVAHQQTSSQIWIGDGTAILPANWTDENTRKCLKRCSGAIGSLPRIETRKGLRPYIQCGNDPCLLKKIGPRAWVATGAGKSGTIAAGWVARRILDASC